MERAETWAAAYAHPEYEVSDLGRVRRIAAGHGTRPGRLLTSFLGKDGYPRVTLGGASGRKQWLLHRLVALTFLGEPPVPGMDAAHKDGNCTNAHLCNLRWSTRAENNADKIAHGTHLVGERKPMAKLRDADIPVILASSLSNRRLAAEFGVSHTRIGRIRRGSDWVHVKREAA